MAYLSSSVRAVGCDERALAASRHTHNSYVYIVGPVVPFRVSSVVVSLGFAVKEWILT